MNEESKVEEYKRCYKCYWREDIDVVVKKLHLPQMLDNLWNSLSREEKDELYEWKEMDDRIRNNNFPELQV